MENKICGCTIPYADCCGKWSQAEIDVKIQKAMDDWFEYYSKLETYQKEVIEEVNRLNSQRLYLNPRA